MTPRFLAALACYGVLALLAGFSLEEMPRTVVWMILGSLAVRTWIDQIRKQRE